MFLSFTQRCIHNMLQSHSRYSVWNSLQHTKCNLDSMVNELNCASALHWLSLSWQAHSCSVSPRAHQLVMVSFPVRWCRMSDPKTPSHLILDWLCFQSKMVCEQNRFIIYETHFWSPGYWNITSTFLLSIKLLRICHQVHGTITGNGCFPHFFQHYCHVLGLMSANPVNSDSIKQHMTASHGYILFVWLGWLTSNSYKPLSGEFTALSFINTDNFAQFLHENTSYIPAI